jgi:hypothetical protein
MGEGWEYKIVDISAARWTSSGLPADINEKFDRYGAQGWELVATESIIRGVFYGSSTIAIIAFFKRRR